MTAYRIRGRGLDITHPGPISISEVEEAKMTDFPDIAGMDFAAIKASLQEVKSSNIAGIHWVDGALVVGFRNGTMYRYAGVPKELHDEFLAAASPGKFFQEKIRNKFDGVKIDEPTTSQSATVGEGGETAATGSQPSPLPEAKPETA